MRFFRSVLLLCLVLHKALPNRVHHLKSYSEELHDRQMDSNGSKPVILRTQLWRPPRDLPSQFFPENLEESVLSRPQTGICFSGGGYRSYIATLGYLRGLHDLNLLESTRYIFGISGGSWAVVLFSYYARGKKGVAGSDSELLGNITEPEDESMAALRRIPSTCARKSATSWMVARLAKLAAKQLRSRMSLSRVWRTAVGQVFLERYGIPPTGLMAYDADNVARIVARNPSLANDTFLTLLPGRPFPVLGMTMLGPLDMEPFPAKTRAYKLLELTPLYVGSPSFGNVTFVSNRWCRSCRNRSVTVGGYIEPFAFGGQSVSPDGLPEGEESGEVSVAAGGPRFSVADAAGTGSYAPGGFFASSEVLAWLGKLIGVEFNYFAPGSPRFVDTPTAFGDGGDMVSPHLIGLLQRGVSSVVFFGNFDTPLRPRSQWDPHSRAPTAADIDDDMPPLFGIVLPDLGERTSYEFRYNHVFRETDFARVVSALQAAQATGRGIVATTELETVGNQWWSLRAGFRVNVTWVYLSRSAEWERRLAPSVRSLAVPEKDPEDVTRARERGPFKGFPYYGTGKLWYDEANTNLLADLSGWVVKNNAETLKAALGRK